ncbi:MAG: hypothetical protein FJ297_06890 [Planctomycetes bacterium]|nr:hypothetical protein [Planctomycetota bacterium]
MGHPPWRADGDNSDQAVEFCLRLSATAVERSAGRVYRLPTEAEWEFACRACTTTRWCCGDDEVQLADHARFGQNSNERTHAVAEKTPNAFGLFDMHGNNKGHQYDWA